MSTNTGFVAANGYDDMFESGNFKRRKRMRRHSYRTGLYKEWMAAGQTMYRPTYPGSLYVSGYSPYAPNPLSSYTSLPQLSPPSYQYGASLGYVDTTGTSVAAASPLSSFSSTRTPGGPGPGEDRGGYPSQPFNLF